jgi:hypothetical protein
MSKMTNKRAIRKYLMDILTRAGPIGSTPDSYADSLTADFTLGPSRCDNVNSKKENPAASIKTKSSGV